MTTEEEQEIEQILNDYYSLLIPFNELYGRLVSFAKKMNSNHRIIFEKDDNLIKFRNTNNTLITEVIEKEDKKIAPLKEQNMKIYGVTIKKNKKCNSYYVRKRIDNKQIYITAKTQKSVIENLKLILNKSAKQKPNVLTLNQWYNNWLELYKISKVKQTTINDYKKTLKNIPNNILSKNIKLITLDEIMQVLNSIDKERTKQKVFELLNAIFDKALKHNKITNNIFTLIEKPKHKREKGTALNYEQQNLFIKNCSNDLYKDLFLLILYQGLRIGEALAITGNDIVNNYINIEKSITRENILDTTKNEQSIRKIPIFKPTKIILNNYKNYNSKRLFNISYSTAQQRFKKLLNNLPNISIHDLRHTFITNCKNENIPEHIIQKWVGHEIGSKITSQIYTHVTNDANLFNINKLNQSKFYSSSTHE